MTPKKKIALVAHDNKKRDLVEWSRFTVPAPRPPTVSDTKKRRLAAAHPEHEKS
jgi:hypothetical protein